MPTTGPPGEGTDVDDVLREMRAMSEKLRTESRAATELRLKWERQRTDDPELIKKLDRALAGEISWLDVLTSSQYERAHAAEFAEAREDFERRRADGTLPTAEEADAGLGEFFARMRTEVAAAEEATHDAATAEGDEDARYDPTVVPPDSATPGPSASGRSGPDPLAPEPSDPDLEPPPATVAS